MKTHNGFFKRIGVLTAVLVGLIFALEHYQFASFHPYVWYIQAFHLIVSIFSYQIILNGAKKGGLDFSNAVMMASALRLLPSAGLMLAYFYFFKENQLSFVLTFFLFYLCYTTFEITTQLSKLRQISNPPSKSNENHK